MKVKFKKLKKGDWIRLDWIKNVEFFVVDPLDGNGDIKLGSTSFKSGAYTIIEKILTDAKDCEIVGISVETKHNIFKRFLVGDLLHPIKKKPFDDATLRLIELLR